MDYKEKKMEPTLEEQKELKKELIEVEAGEGAVVVQFSGELKIKEVRLNPELIDFDDMEELEHWIKIAVHDGLEEAQKIAAEKMQPLMGGLGLGM